MVYCRDCKYVDKNSNGRDYCNLHDAIISCGINMDWICRGYKLQRKGLK